MRLFPNHDAQLRRPEESVSLDIPAGALQQKMRAAASAVKLATVAPVTTPPAVPSGKPSSSRTHSTAVSSNSAATGVAIQSPAF